MLQQKAMNIFPKLIAGVALLVLAACGPETPPETEVGAQDIVWPPPPNQARISYLYSVKNKNDVVPREDKSRLADILLGDEDNSARDMQKPYDVATDSKGRVFVTDTQAAELIVFDRENQTYRYWGTGGLGRLRLPLGVAVDDSDLVYVSDATDKRVVVFGSEGQYLRAFGTPEELGNPAGVAVNSKLGRVYVVDAGNHRLAVYDMAGNLLSTHGEEGQAPGQFHFPSNVAIDRDGNIYVADTLNFRIQVFDADVNFIKMFGKLGSQIGQFTRPKGVGVDSRGNIYVVDSAFANFQIFDNDGRMLMGVRAADRNEPGGFSLPAGLHIDDKDRIYVVDQFNARVQAFQFLGGDGTKEAAPTEEEGGQTSGK